MDNLRKIAEKAMRQMEKENNLPPAEFIEHIDGDVSYLSAFAPDGREYGIAWHPNGKNDGGPYKRK